MPLRLRSLLLSLLALALVPTLAACGGGGGGDADSLLRQTFTDSKPVRSGKLDLSFSLSLKGGVAGSGGAPVQIRLSGPFTSTGPKTLPKFDLSLSAGGGLQSLQAGAVSTGDKGFLRLQGSTYQVPDEIFSAFRQGFEQAQAKSGSKQGVTLGSLGIDPRDWLADPKVEGEEDVGGTTTKHITSGVRVKRFVEDINKVLARASELGLGGGAQLPSQLTAEQRRLVEQSIKDPKLDVYTGKDDKILRRLVLALKLDVPEADRAKAGGLSSGDLRFDLSVTGVNEPQTIREPTGARPFSELTRQLQQLGILGGSSGSTGGGSATKPPSGASAESLQRYTACLQQAGSDIKKAQKCASLLGK